MVFYFHIPLHVFINFIAWPLNGGNSNEMLAAHIAVERPTFRRYLGPLFCRYSVYLAIDFSTLGRYAKHLWDFSLKTANNQDPSFSQC